MNFPTDARLVAGFLLLGLGALGAAAILLFGSAGNSLHVQGLGWCFTTAIGSGAAIIGSDVWTKVKS